VTQALRRSGTAKRTRGPPPADGSVRCGPRAARCARAAIIDLLDESGKHAGHAGAKAAGAIFA